MRHVYFSGPLLIIASVALAACGSDDDGGGGGSGGATGGTAGTSGSGGTGNTGGTCQDACGPAASIRCSGNSLQTCQIASSGCLTWSETTNCTALGQVCDDTSGTAQCVKTCTDQCTTAGATQCNGGTIESCSAISGGCLSWNAGTDCSLSGQACDATGGTAQCVTTCTDQCTSGATQCSGNVIQTCGTGASGCLEWSTTTDCAATNEVCDDSGSAPVCVTPCTDQCPTAGDKQCSGDTIETCATQANGCLDWQLDTSCPTGQTCFVSAGAPVCGAPTGEDCSEAVPLKVGANSVAWTATTADYVTTAPSCASSFSLAGPDIVLSYTAPTKQTVDLSFTKPGSTRWVAVVSDAACGTLTPQLACISDYTPTTMGDSFLAQAGSTYYVYVRDTTSGSNPLDNPLAVNLAVTECSTATPVTSTTVSPANGSTTTSLSQPLVIELDGPVDTDTGTITLTGNGSTSITYDLSLSPSQVSFSNSDKTITVAPGALPAGEVITVTWTLQDAGCENPIAAPTWSYTVVTPPCAPGSGGMVGTTVTTLATTLPTLTEYYLTIDENPSGYIYVGGSSSIYRVAKATGAADDVTTLAGLTSSNLGYDALAQGQEVFTLEGKGSGTSGFLWRLTTDAGATWNLTDYVTLAADPADWPQSVASYGSQYYFLTNEFGSDPTEIYSVPSSGTPPLAATKAASFTGEGRCAGLALDDDYYYMACGTGDRLIRVDRTTNAVTLITDAFDLDTNANGMVARDTDNDGTADFLYFKGGRKEVYFVCNPASATPYVDTLTTFGASSSTSSYGLDFDATTNTLYAYDDGPREIVMIK